MIRRLIILLFIVGCDYAPTEHTHDAEYTHEDEIKDVAWLSRTDSLMLPTETILYQYYNYTEGYEPMVIDTVFWCNSAYTPPYLHSYDYCIQMCEEQNEELPDGAMPLNCPEEPNLAFFISSLQGDTTTYMLTDSVMSISHFVTPNYFEIIDANSNINTIIYSDYIKYEYK